MALKFIDQAEMEGKKILARFDFNVPLDHSGPEAKIIDPYRIDLTLETIRFILEQRPKKIVLMSHLGRPKGAPQPELSLEPVAKYLAEQLDEEVVLTESCLDRGIATLLGLNGPRIILLQNLRFHPEEKNNDLEFARSLSQYGDIYINDAFGAAHRKHASTYLINAFFKNKAYGGFLIKKEVEALEKIAKTPKKPFKAIIGGAKVSDKIQVIESLLRNVDHLLIGGAMAYPFLKARGHQVGTSLCSDEDVTLARKILNSTFKNKIILPIDHAISSTFAGPKEYAANADIPAGKMGLDIGAKTLALFQDKLGDAKTVFWNGPMGIFESKDYASGTFGVAQILAKLPAAFTLVGGGDSVNALNQSGLASQMSHISTGGGAGLEFIVNDGSLPGISALRFGIDL